jgi:probable rRNA maturation factor
MDRKLKQSGSVNFHFEAQIPLRDRNRLKKFIANLLVKETKQLTCVNYIFCHDKALLQINRQYLGHNFYTDIITFDLSPSSKEILADVYISVDRVKENAGILKVSVKEELHRVMFHGLLHLCGYNDKTAKQRKLMREKERSYLELYFLRFT